MILDRDMPLTTDCPWCGAKAWPGDGHERNDHRCAKTCPKPGGWDNSPAIIHCTPGDRWDMG